MVAACSAVWEATSPELAIMRMHARNTESWEKKGLTAIVRPFNHDYSDAEVEEIAGNIRKLSASVNNYQDQGQRNSRTLAGFLR
jgi:hypothetical protein